MTVTLYSRGRAPNPRRVRWVMAEKGVTDIEVVEVDIFAGEHRTPDYLGRFGLPTIPALDLGDGAALTESLAICRYLESLYPEPNLFGRDPREEAAIEMWTRRAEMMVAMPLMLSVRHSHPALAALETQEPVFARRHQQDAERALSFFDRRLSDAPFVAGERFTIADIVAFIGIDFARMIKFQPGEELADLRRWMDNVRARPAAAAGQDG